MSSSDPIKEFQQEVATNIEELCKDSSLRQSSIKFMHELTDRRYPYNFTWMGLPIIQFPQDIQAMQEIIWEVKPDLIIETGVARGGSLVMYAGLMKMMDLKGEVVGVDIDIRAHNRQAIESHPMGRDIKLVQGSSIDPEVIAQIRNLAKGKKRILVCLDSMHTHDHVLKELELYSEFVTKGSYLVVFDTVVEEMPKGYYKDRPWDVGNNPYTAVHEFIKDHGTQFEIDRTICGKLVLTVSRNGFLKRIG